MQKVYAKREIEVLSKKTSEIKENYDIKTAMVKILEHLMHELNTNHFKLKYETERKIKIMERDRSIKMSHDKKRI